MVNQVLPGMVFRCSWNGMADFYEVVRTTQKSVVLKEIDWTTCSAPAGEEESDPVHRWAKLKRNADGSFIYVKDYNGEVRTYTKRLHVNPKTGNMWFKSPNYGGAASVHLNTSDYMEMSFS